MDITALLAISFWPYMIPFVLTIDDAAAPQSSCVHVLGRGPVRLPADAPLHDHQLQRLQGQSRIRAPALLRLLGSRTPVATIKLPPSSAGPVRCETAERDNARSGPTVLTVRSGVPRMAVQ